MAVKKNKNNSFFVGLFLLVFIFIAYLFWFAYSGNDQIAKDYALGNFQMIKAEDLNSIKTFKACGNWPIIMSGGSDSRGNPFSRRAVSLPTMTASSTPECLPVGNN